MSPIIPGEWFVNLDDLMPADPNEAHQVQWTLTPWAVEHGYTQEMLGFLPQFLHTDDPRPAAEQFDENYAHGGGWNPHPNMAPLWHISDHDKALIYGDGAEPAPEVHRLLATAQLRDERIHFFDGSWVAIIQPDGSFEVERMD
jgi:hypothetical protein